MTGTPERVSRFGFTALLFPITAFLGVFSLAHAQEPTREACDRLMSDTLEEVRRATEQIPKAIKALQDSGCQGSRAACTQAANSLRAETEGNHPDKVASIRLAQRAVSCIP